MAQKVTGLEVLRIVLSIGPTETSHFQTWHDKAGNAPQVTDGTLVFPDFNSPALAGEGVKKNLIMPEPCVFLSRSLPKLFHRASDGGKRCGLAADADRAQRQI
jgi:hypothetical protein